MQKVYIIEDHPIMIAALRGIICSLALEHIGNSSDPRRATEQITLHKPELVITDLYLHDSPCFELISSLKKACPSCRILVLTVADEQRIGEKALNAGASGILMKSANISQIKEAITNLLNGKRHLSPELANHLLRSDSERQHRSAKLTKREYEIFQHIGFGKTTRSIAAILGISVKTVEAHKENIKSKVCAQSSTHLTVIARDEINQTLNYQS